MNKTKAFDPKEYDDGMLPEYGFTGKKPIRGKYYRAMQQGYIVRIHNEDGTVTEKHYGPLIALVPQKQIGEKKAKYKVGKKSTKRVAAQK